MSDPAPEYVWVRYRRDAAIKIPIDEVDSYLAQGYKVVPMRDEPTIENS